jgi:long-chain acyl-CoA synthetase
VAVADLRPLVDVWARATAELTGPGGPYEVVEEDVLGERMAVFRDRAGSLRALLERAASEHAGRDCMIFGDGRRYTFAGFAEEVAATAAVLADRGIRPGDRVAILAANSPGWLLVSWAATSMGAVVVAMNGWWTQTECANALELTEPALLVGDGRRLERLGPVDVPVLDLDADLPALLEAHRGAPLPDQPIDEDDPAVLLFTSGTTGRPKAAVLSHRNVVAFVQLQGFLAARGMAAAGITPPSGPPATRLAVFPLFHVSGLSASVGTMATGGTTVWPLGRFDPEHVIALTKEHGIAGWGGTVTHVLRLLDCPAIESLEPTSITNVGIGGSATSPQLIRRTEERFPHLKGTFSSGYGSTESGGLISYASNAMLVAAPECVGPPLPTVEVRIVDPMGEDVPVGEEGEICARSPLVMQGYWRHPEANEAAFLPGRWLRTGDFGRLTEDGVLMMASRRRDLIIRGGENVYPFEVEYRLEEHPDVVEAAVIGVDHPTLGQEVAAVVVVAEGASVTAEALQAWCAEALSPYKVPTQVEVRTAALPRNPTGKVMKHLLGGDESASGFVEE